ncbi:ComEC/Rec2 family competence protein [Sphingomonas sp. NPDC019816]|uniref:ComEC/Rec2 family competence protein n=1 Tax=Sphingomonas sp. NPDC019816 TaxID=3390679 RepID=UPI003D01BBA0
MSLYWRTGRDRAERWAEAERTQIPLWTPVGLGLGIAAWFMLPDARAWTAFLCLSAAMAVTAATVTDGGRLARMVGGLALLLMAGLSLAWLRAESVALPVLVRPVVADVAGRVEGVDRLAARRMVRVRLRPLAARDGRGRAVVLPPRIRISLADTDVPGGLGPGALIRLRARLMPPAGPIAPGGYDFARAAWFQGIGATGRGFAPVTVLRAADRSDGLRQRLSRRISERVGGGAGGIAAALATGDVGAIGQADAEAMRRAGLAHLLSVSGLHITAVVGIVMTMTIRLLALWPWLALRARLPLVGALAGALAALGYTVLTGAEVPTIRSCVAAMLVLVALAMGRQAVTLRLVAAGAVLVLLFRPEALMGASFQLSFAAITAIIALHEHPAMRRWFGPHPDWRWSALRSGGGLLVTGLVVEAALMPIAIHHFHKAGLYGAFVNIVAIPWTTFVAMPIEILALLLEPLGLAGPFWRLLGWALGLLLSLAHHVAGLPGSAMAVPVSSDRAFGLAIAGGLWLALWRTRGRWLGVPLILLGVGGMLVARAPDMIVTGDGRHAAIRTDAGMALLRERAGDYMRTTLAEMSGLQADLAALSDQPVARCGADVCLTRMTMGGRSWRIAATRSGYTVPWRSLVALCGTVDVMIADRRLPDACQPYWLKLDAATLRKTGGVSVWFDPARVETVNSPGDGHPWRRPSAEGRPSR